MVFGRLKGVNRSILEITIYTLFFHPWLQLRVYCAFRRLFGDLWFEEGHRGLWRDWVGARDACFVASGHVLSRFSGVTKRGPPR